MMHMLIPKWAQRPYGNGESPNGNYFVCLPNSIWGVPIRNRDCIFCHPFSHADLVHHQKNGWETDTFPLLPVPGGVEAYHCSQTFDEVMVSVAEDSADALLPTSSLRKRKYKAPSESSTLFAHKHKQTQTCRRTNSITAQITQKPPSLIFKLGDIVLIPLDAVLVLLFRSTRQNQLVG